MRLLPDPRDIPPEHLMDPRGSRVGFFGAPHGYGPPPSWEDQHHFAEVGGYYRIAGRWTQSGASTPTPVRTVPVLVLYAPMYHRSGWRALLQMGWCVDA